MFTSATDPFANGNLGGSVSHLARFVRRAFVGCLSSESGRLLADVLKNSVAELRRDDEGRMSQ